MAWGQEPGQKLAGVSAAGWAVQTVRELERCWDLGMGGGWGSTRGAAMGSALARASAAAWEVAWVPQVGNQ